MHLNSFRKILKRLLLGFTLTCDLQFSTLRDVPFAFFPKRRR